jgi:hypothetical protein
LQDVKQALAVVAEIVEIGASTLPFPPNLIVLQPSRGGC